MTKIPGRIKTHGIQLKRFMKTTKKNNDFPEKKLQKNVEKNLKKNLKKNMKIFQKNSQKKSEKNTGKFF